MTPSLLAEYVFYCGLALSGIVWMNMAILFFCGAFDRENKQIGETEYDN